MAAAATHVVILNEIIDPKGKVGDWRLCLHWARYQYGNGNPPEYGYRFIWRRPDNSLGAARGQARIPSKAHADRLWKIAAEQGWADNNGDEDEAA